MKRHDRFHSAWRWIPILVCAVLLLTDNLALAQEAPPPHKSPRVPVNREALPDSKESVPRSRDVEGAATIIDGEHIRINDIDLRLFGVVPPQLAASFGPQARTALDELTRGQNVDCHIRDRDHDGRFLATCFAANTKTDLAFELLKRGLAVTARGSIQATELATPYETAEQAAQAQKLGLWGVAPPAPASAAPLAAVAKTNNTNVPPLPVELKKEEKAAPVPEKPAPATAFRTDFADEVQTALPSAFVPASAFAPLRDDDTGVSGFFARYQLLITGLVMLATALGIMIVIAAERRKDRRDEMKAIAAALRGELLAARAVCQARLKTWNEGDDRNAAWPRIRATLYQAYVGRLGWLGAVLARQVASIYGQASDYAAYFNPNSGSIEPRGEVASRRQALQALMQHIEQVLPKLAMIEQSGIRPKGRSPAKPQQASFAPPPEPVMPRIMEDAGLGEALSYETASHSEPSPPPVARAPAAWNLAKIFKRARSSAKSAGDEPMPDYTTLIEEEMARMSSEKDAASPPSPGAPKMRTGA